MSNKQDREHKELENLIKDPRYSRKFWQSVGNAIASRPAVRLDASYDKDGNETFNSMLDRYTYESLKGDIDKLCKDGREPTQLEMIMQAQMIRARFDTSAATFVRDTLGAKPVDESKMDMDVRNPYENLSDEELELLNNYRKEQERKALEEAKPQIVEDTRKPRNVDILTSD